MRFLLWLKTDRRIRPRLPRQEALPVTVGNAAENANLFTGFGGQRMKKVTTMSPGSDASQWG
jgi:hypothetical protein